MFNGQYQSRFSVILSVGTLPIFFFVLFVALSFPTESLGIDQARIWQSSQNELVPLPLVDHALEISPTNVISETLIVPFANGTTGVDTNRSYVGETEVKISGIGQAASTQWSDAFYIFTDKSGNPITPYHPLGHYNYTLWINGGPADIFVNSIPPYNPSHTYTFDLLADGNPINFAVGDSATNDNNGEYIV